MSPGDRYVWEIPSVNFGPVYMTVRRIIRGGRRPRVIFDCKAPGGRPYRHTRELPLPPFMQPRNWTEQDLEVRS